jgi:uncharacterized protein (DUF2461 family)
MDFTGFSSQAFDFYRGLSRDNSKDHWKQHRQVYEQAVRAPMAALLAELAAEFGEIRMLRPQRDTRMSHDKSPYKTYQGALTDLQPCLGFWLHLDSDALYASGRFYPTRPKEVETFRTVGGRRPRQR